MNKPLWYSRIQKNSHPCPIAVEIGMCNRKLSATRLRPLRTNAFRALVQS